MSVIVCFASIINFPSSNLQYLYRLKNRSLPSAAIEYVKEVYRGVLGAAMYLSV